MWSGWGRGAKARRELRRVLPDLKGVRLPDLRKVHLPEFKDLHLPDLHAPEIDWGRGRMGSRVGALWPALFAAAGTGAAVWWWNQWARGRAETEAAQAREADLSPAHTALEPADGGPVETLPEHVKAALDESLAVQAQDPEPGPKSRATA